MKAIDYLKEKGRMTKDCTIHCADCPFEYDNNGTENNCTNFDSKYPEQAIEIVEKWAKENPVKTYKDVFLEKFPNATMGEDGCPTCCPTSLFNIEQECPKIPCVKCWNREYKEEK